MSKFLKQSKTFLPMVFQKSTTDSIQILQKCPSFSTAQQEELKKQETSNQETLKQTLPKQEVLKQEISEQGLMLKQEPPQPELPKQELIDQDMLKKTSNTPKDNLKIVLHKSPEIPLVDSCKIQSALKTPSDQNLESLKVVTVNPKSEKTLLKALLLDFLQVQRGLLVLLSEGRVWLWWQALGIQARPGTSGALRVEQSEVKEREPVLLSVAQKKADKKPKEPKKAEDKPHIKSNLWEAIQENSPQWQESISNKLGEAQKVVVEKLSK